VPAPSNLEIPIEAGEETLIFDWPCGVLRFKASGESMLFTK